MHKGKPLPKCTKYTGLILIKVLRIHKGESLLECIKIYRLNTYQKVQNT